MPKQKSKIKKENKKAKKVAGSQNGMKFEIFAVCAIAVCAYLLVCMYSNAGGFVGEWIKKIMMGLMGTCASIFPFATAILLI